MYLTQGRYEEAESLYKRSLAITEKVLGPEHPNIATCLRNLSLIYGRQGRYAEAETLYKQSLEISEKALGPEHLVIALSLNSLASLYGEQDRHAEAEPLYKRSSEILENLLGPEHPDLAWSLGGLAESYQMQDRYYEAEPLYRRALNIAEKALRPEHPYVTELLNNLVALYDEQGRLQDALPLVRQGIDQGTAEPFPALNILIGAQRKGLISEAQSLADSYVVLQTSSSTKAAESVKKLAERFASGSDELAAIVRKDQDLKEGAEALYTNFISSVSDAPGTRNKTADEALRKRLAEIDWERAKLSDELQERFPDYIALANPPPLSLEDTQELLADDEAIAAFHIGGKRSFAWVVTKTAADWTEIAVDAKKLELDIKSLRLPLTFAIDAPFDADELDRAHKIYQQTFGPLAELLKGKTRR